jgi:Flp pilus assembly protein TadG
MKQGSDADTRRKRGRVRLRGESGAAAVEFALVFPLLLVVMIGIFEFGRVWNIHHVVTDATREGARRAVVKDGVTGVAKQTAVINAVNNRVTSAGLPAATLIPGNDPMTACPTSGEWTVPAPPSSGISIAGCGWGGATNTQARVIVRAPFPFQVLGSVISLIGGGIGPVMLRGDFSMRNE